MGLLYLSIYPPKLPTCKYTGQALSIRVTVDLDLLVIGGAWKKRSNTDSPPGGGKMVIYANGRIR